MFHRQDSRGQRRRPVWNRHNYISPISEASRLLALTCPSQGSESGQLIQLVIVVVAVVSMIVCANLGENSPAWRVTAYVLAGGAAALLSVVAILGLVQIALDPAGTALAAHCAQVSVSRFTSGTVVQLVAGGAAGAALLPPVRRAAARIARGFRPQSSINAVALSLYLLTLLFFISTQVSADQLKQLSQPARSPSVVFIIATNQLPFVVVALLGAGLFTRRSLRQTLSRLGLYWPGWLWIAAAAGVAVALVVFGTFFDVLMTRFTPEQTRNIQQVSNQLLKNVDSLLPAIAIAVAAGVGEEILFRGALLPRLGNPASALLFAILHAQYAISLATLEIFILGLVLGILRRRAGTTTAIVAHSGYDLILLVISLYIH